MSLENYTGQTSALVATNPADTDPKSEGAAHIRGMKATMLAGMITTNGAVNSDPANQTINGALNTGNLTATGAVSASGTVTANTTINTGSTGNDGRINLSRSSDGAPVANLRITGGELCIDNNSTTNVNIQTGGANRAVVSSAGVAVVGNITQISGLPALNFASDAAAGAGGVSIGGLYHNAGVVHVRLT